MTALLNPMGITTASRRGTAKTTYDFYSDLFDNHVHLPPHHLREDGHVIPEVLSSEIRHAIISVTCRNARFLNSGRPARPLYKKGDPYDIGNYRPVCLLSVIYMLFIRVILNRIEKLLDEGTSCEQTGFRKGFSTIDHIHTISKLIEVSQEHKMTFCLTFIDLKAFDSWKAWTTKASLST
ncbi:hypothetical protein RB195_023139 [Necator americanus]